MKNERKGFPIGKVTFVQDEKSPAWACGAERGARSDSGSSSGSGLVVSKAAECLPSGQQDPAELRKQLPCCLKDRSSWVRTGWVGLCIAQPSR
ncbi:hypothetical protein AAFF_G00258630 [Aldrovandia affinis]|uniref:Uncharacterized protein n=1 Tax=Aldrovandia affinis TaxID=143900 RepID=A0AAD7WU73_9TELE|nr:hypothetical protein AAFF_G00258630 [Aldrovandia affinis]